VLLPKSDNEESIKANADIYEFELEKGDVEVLDGLDEGNKRAIVEAVKNG
jgi:diketogulonate reductase-like aldo/keto reductase